MTYKSTTVLISIIRRSACILLRFYVYTEQKDFNDKGEESYGGARGGIRGNSDSKFVMLFGVAVIIELVIIGDCKIVFIISFDIKGITSDPFM